MLKFVIRNIIVDEEILGEDDLELVSNIEGDTVKMREIEMQEKRRLKLKRRLKEIEKEEMQEKRRIEEM